MGPALRRNSISESRGPPTSATTRPRVALLRAVLRVFAMRCPARPSRRRTRRGAAVAWTDGALDNVPNVDRTAFARRGGDGPCLSVGDERPHQRAGRYQVFLKPGSSRCPGVPGPPCERIKTTPATLRLHAAPAPQPPISSAACCRSASPQPLGWATPLITAIVGYTFLRPSTRLGDELEQPFGSDVKRPCRSTRLSRGLERGRPGRRWASATCRRCWKPQDYLLT